MNTQRRKKRIVYGVICFLLLIIEVVIALYVHDTFIRPYIGDILVVIVLYFAVRAIEPEKFSKLPFFIFLFASLIESLQYLQLVKRFGLEGNKILRIVIGTTFDVKDILCYGIGCILVVVFSNKF